MTTDTATTEEAATTDTTVVTQEGDGGTQVVENGGDTATTEAATEEKAFALPDDFDWRTHFTGGDEKLLKLAGRYQSPKAMVEALGQLRSKLSSGKVIEPLGEDSTDEEKAAFRKALDIPDSADAYLEKLPDGLVIGDDDKPAVDTFVAAMHEANAPRAVTNAALKAYYDIVDQQAAEQLNQVSAAKKTCEDALREEWAQPGEYRRNENILVNYVSALPEPVRDAFDKGLDANGVPLGYNPAIRQWLVARALEDNPIATVVPGAGANQADAIADEIAKIEKAMRENRSAYNKDERMQSRYRELLTARERMK